MNYIKPFYIAVSPVGSKFARALQAALRERVTNTIYRALPERVGRKAQRLGRSYFSVTRTPLNKVQQLERFKQHNVSHPPFETDSSRLSSDVSNVWFARTLINSTNGRGIVEFDLRDERAIPKAPLYTAYIPKKAEYRFHVFDGLIIDIQQKKKKKDFDETQRDTRVRNLHNGYVYCRDGVSPPDGAAAMAVRAVNACGYLYGAVDVVYNEKRNQAYVLEVNSRPGLQGTTLDRYADAIIKSFNLRRK